MLYSNNTSLHKLAEMIHEATQGNQSSIEQNAIKIGNVTAIYTMYELLVSDNIMSTFLSSFLFRVHQYRLE